MGGSRRSHHAGQVIACRACRTHQGGTVRLDLFPRDDGRLPTQDHLQLTSIRERTNPILSSVAPRSLRTSFLLPPWASAFASSSCTSLSPTTLASSVVTTRRCGNNSTTSSVRRCATCRGPTLRTLNSVLFTECFLAC